MKPWVSSGVEGHPGHFEDTTLENAPYERLWVDGAGVTAHVPLTLRLNAMWLFTHLGQAFVFLAWN